jgi:hypothetical protein
MNRFRCYRILLCKLAFPWLPAFFAANAANATHSIAACDAGRVRAAWRCKQIIWL